MKRGLLSIGLIISLASIAQPSVKLYGYSQLFTPGMVPQRDIPSENGGRVIKSPGATTHYFIFMRTSVLVNPEEIWLGGKWYLAKASPVGSTPVMAEYPEKKTLVPSTKLKVQQVEQGDTLTNALTRTTVLKKMMAANELIISYTWKGKKYYTSQKKLTKLETVHGQ